ncbi:hypothetical protein BC829DRAFT_228879 [Chytridium lagenaria]|nr:hypothetical protein BC829DRAFT_228879 [Chytridium lagenaria]
MSRSSSRERTWRIMFKQLMYCHNRSLTQQSRALGALVLEIFVALFAGFLMGISTQGRVNELFNGIYDGFMSSSLRLPRPGVSLRSSPCIAVALAGAPAGVKVFGEEKPVFWRERQVDTASSLTTLERLSQPSFDSF